MKYGDYKTGNKCVNCQHTSEYNKTLHRKYQKFCFDTVHLLVLAAHYLSQGEVPELLSLNILKWIVVTK